MTYWILTDKCTVIARSTVKSLEDYELRDPAIISQPECFTAKILDRNQISKEFTEPFVMVDDECELDPKEEAEIYTSPEADDFTPKLYDEYLLDQVSLPVDGDLLRGEVIRRTRDPNGRPIGTRNTNPILDMARTCILKLTLRAIPSRSLMRSLIIKRIAQLLILVRLLKTGPISPKGGSSLSG